MDHAQIITIDPGKLSGKPCIRGTRITVYDVLGYMAAGMSRDEILADFPSLSEVDLAGGQGLTESHRGRMPHVSLLRHGLRILSKISCHLASTR